MRATGLDKAELRDPLLNRLFAYWELARAGRLMPPRKSIDPIEMRFLLGSLSLIDVLERPARFRVRLQGTHFERWIGCDLTGKPIDDLPSRDLRDFVSRCLDTVVATRAPMAALEELFIDGMPRRFETLFLPLSSNDSAVEMVLAAIRCYERMSRA